MDTRRNSLAVSVGIMLYASTGVSDCHFELSNLFMCVGQLQSVLLFGDQMTIAVAAIAGCRLILSIRSSQRTSDTSNIDLGSRLEARRPHSFMQESAMEP